MTGGRAALIRALAFGARQLRRAGSLLSFGVLGAMRRAELQQAIGKGWDRYGQLGAPPNEPTLARWEAEFYGEHLPPGGRVLLVGCGSGRDLVALAQRGHAVDGLDIAKDALAACRADVAARGLVARLYDSSVEEAHFEGEYDAVVFTWFGYGYVPGTAARVRTLTVLRGILRPGGRILLTYQPRGERQSGIPSAFARLVGRVTGSDWVSEPGDFVEPLGGTPSSLHFEHSFAPQQVVEEAQSAGLRVSWHEQRAEGRLVLLRD